MGAHMDIERMAAYMDVEEEGVLIYGHDLVRK